MSDPLFSVEDQVVLISGASRGIGRALAEGFARRKAQVVITGRVAETVEATAREIGSAGNVVGKVCDAADAKAFYGHSVNAAKTQVWKEHHP